MKDKTSYSRNKSQTSSTTKLDTLKLDLYSLNLEWISEKYQANRTGLKEWFRLTGYATRNNMSPEECKKLIDRHIKKKEALLKKKEEQVRKKKY